MLVAAVSQSFDATPSAIHTSPLSGQHNPLPVQRRTGPSFQPHTERPSQRPWRHGCHTPSCVLSTERCQQPTDAIPCVPEANPFILAAVSVPSGVPMSQQGIIKCYFASIRFDEDFFYLALPLRIVYKNFGCQ